MKSATATGHRPAGLAPRRIAILRALQLGDMLCAVPALRALRAAAPRAHITLIGLPWAADFVQRFSAYLDDHMVLPGLPDQPAADHVMPAFIAAAQQRHFDLAIQMHGNGLLTNQLVHELGARHTAGFYVAGRECPERARYLLWIERENEVLRGLRLMQLLGAETQGTALEFPLFESDHAALHCIGHLLPAPGTYVCIHPGARLPSRRWPAQRFARVADELARSGLHVVLTGTAQGAEATRAVLHEMRAPALDLAGKTELGALGVLMANARLVVCNDTGVSHLAAAVDTPSVVICSGTDSQRWAPLERRRHRVLYHDIFCRPCLHFSCPIGHPCALGVSVDAVLQQARELLLEDMRFSLGNHVTHRGDEFAGQGFSQ